jgi:hypothetical protein
VLPTLWSAAAGRRAPILPVLREILEPVARPTPVSYSRRMAGLVVDWAVLCAVVTPLWLWIAGSGGPNAEGAAGIVVGNVVFDV